MKTGFEVVHKPGVLCGAAEAIFRSSKRQKSLMINGFLTLKFSGELVAICTENRGNFERGRWYGPTDREFREQLRKDFDRGLRRVVYETGRWSEFRELNEKYVRCFDDAILAAEDMKTSLPVIMNCELPEFGIAGYVTRKHYRQIVSAEEK